MTQTQTTTTTTPSHIAALLGRTRDIIDTAQSRGISITTREAAAIAAADPRDAESLADAISDSGHVPLIVVAHPECTLRGDGAVVPEDVCWEVCDDTCTTTDASPVDWEASDVLDSIDVDAWGADTSDGPVHWRVEVRLAVVTPGGYADHIQGSRIITADQDELEEERERNGGCGRDGHDWHADISVVGGISENPGVWGHGGGVIMHEHCARCGVRRTIDTWADDGRGGHMERTVYRAPDDASLAYATRLAALAAIKDGHYKEVLEQGGEDQTVCISIVASDDAAPIVMGREIASAYVDANGDLDVDSDGCGAWLGLRADDVTDVWSAPEHYIAEVWGDGGRPDTAPVLPTLLIDEPDGSVICVYDEWTEDDIYDSDIAAARVHEVDAATWDAIPRKSRHYDALNPPIDRMTPDRAWRLFVGEQSVAEFIAYGGDPTEYTNNAPTCADLSLDERRQVARLLAQLTEAESQP